MLLYSVQGKHPVDLFPQQQQYLHASIHSTVVVILLVVAALYVDQRYMHTLLFTLNQDTLNT